MIRYFALLTYLFIGLGVLIAMDLSAERRGEKLDTGAKFAFVAMWPTLVSAKLFDGYLRDHPNQPAKQVSQ